MSDKMALLTFSIGPVHGFIAQARRISDFWAGSALLSELVGEAVKVVFKEKGSLLFPFIEDEKSIPKGLPNRFVCRIEAARAHEIALAMEKAVRNAWMERVKCALVTLQKYELSKNGDMADPIEIAWSWVPQEGDYADASDHGARQFAASRVFRPFEQTREKGEKCRLCGERTALPDGGRDSVREAWKEAADKSKTTPEAPFFRLKQSKLCLVCATKRLSGSSQAFAALDRFQPTDAEGNSIGEPYYAFVCMDGDRMGQTLGVDPSELKDSDLERFHKAVSTTLIAFADSLREQASADLRLADLGWIPVGKRPQLIYAGGEDVVFVCDPRDALPLARAIQARYKAMFHEVRQKHLKEGSGVALTISAAVLYVHVKHPAGLAFRDAEDLLKRKAKGETGRDAVALRLDKRGGSPVEVAFKWDEPGNAERTWVVRFEDLVSDLRGGGLSSKQSYNLSEEVDILESVLTSEDDWVKWLALRLSRGGKGREAGMALASRVAPFFTGKKTAALRIARFLGVELENPDRTKAGKGGAR